MSILSYCNYAKNASTLCDQYKKEFYINRINANFQRCKLFGLVILFINILLIILDLTIYTSSELKYLTYFDLIYSRIFICTFIILWFLYSRSNQIHLSLMRKRFLCNTFMIINLYWNVFMGLNNLRISGQISAYIICILGISVCLFLTPLETFLTYSSSLLCFIIGLSLVIDSTKLLYSLIFNSCVAVLISFIISRFKFKYFLHDFISTKKLIESKKELEIANQKLKEYEKLRTDFFANISHELKTPINVISCAHQMLDFLVSQEQLKGDNMNKYLKMIKQNSYRLIRLVSNLIDITKIDAFNFHVKLINTDIIKVVEDITMSVVAFIETKCLSITFDTYIEEKIIACDPSQIERIMLNLLSNSVKFTKKGGSIFVNIYSQDNKICISVKDTGIGIPEEMKYLIFDRFIQVDKSISKNSEGCGIGLSLVKSLVEMHGGSIHVNSELGVGSEFIIMLPDTQIDENMTEEYLSLNDEECVKKISIEFSDIYE